jgi:hypothetical protein
LDISNLPDFPDIIDKRIFLKDKFNFDFFINLYSFENFFSLRIK